MFARDASDYRRSLPSGLILSAGIAALVVAAPAFAATWTWTGGSAFVNHWFNGGNWNPTTVPANDGTADIIFAGTTRLTPDLNQAYNVNSVTFNNTAGAFNLHSIAGNTLTIGAGGITNNDADLQIIDHPITLGAPQTWNAASGQIRISDQVNNGGNLLTIDVPAGGTFSFSDGVISGSGGLTKNGLGLLTNFFLFPPSNTYSGTTTVNAGTFELNSTSVRIPGLLNIGDGVGTAIDTVINTQSNQIADSATVNIFPRAPGLLMRRASRRSRT
ncbi:MAG: hypothetical protein L0228_19010 [Planctomycetes bacterium]|nr:hypothetical protein [Planctomycetota bacterium]